MCIRDKCLNILTLFIFAFTTNFSCQTKTGNQTATSSTEKSHSSRQLFLDSLPQPIGYVNDYENIFDRAEENILDSVIADFEKRTTIQVAIVTFDTTMT